MRILDQKQESFLNEERKLLNDLRVALAQFGTTSEDDETLDECIQQLDELFLLVVVGEFNSGKSAFINALLGQHVLEEGVTPTTTQINILRYGEDRTRIVENENQHILSADVEMLANISIVDTPGTNAIIREHEAITSKFVPRSDLVLFITSADRPFTESERIFLERIRNWGKKIVVVLNKIDLFQTEKELLQVQSFIAENAQALFGMTPEIFAVSSRLALRAKQEEPALWLDSRFEPLENYIHDTLDEGERLRLKFLSPLGVGQHLVDKYLSVVESRLEVLKTDFDTIKDVASQLNLYKEDMNRDFNYRIADIDNVLLEMEQRGQAYFDETLRLAKVFDLVNKRRIEKEFENIVVSDTPQQVERKTSELIDWLVDSELRQWQAITEHLAERRYQHKDRIIGDAGGGSFHYDRERLIEGVGRASQRVVENYDKESEAEALADGARNTVAALTAVEVGAVGLGTLVAILATTATADVTGVLLASLMAALGLFIIPAKRRRAKQEMREKIGDMREQLVQSLRTQFEDEIERSIQKINEAISPYTRFVRAEQNKLLADQATFNDIKNRLSQLEVRVDEISKPAAIEKE